MTPRGEHPLFQRVASIAPEVSFRGSRISLHVSKVILYYSMVSPVNNSRVILHDPRVGLQGSKVRIHVSRMSSRGGRVSVVLG
jgi:hypothetical protein